MTMASDFKQNVKAKLLSAFHAFFLLTLTQQGLVLIAFLLFMSILHKSLISFFLIYSSFLLGIYICWVRWSTLDFTPVRAKRHLTIIGIVKEIITVTRSLIDLALSRNRSDSITADAESRHRGSSLNFDHELALFLRYFASDFIDSWFVEIAIDPELKKKIVSTLKLIVDDVIARVGRLDRSATTTKVLRVYQTFFFQVNESRKSLRTKSLFDSNRRLKRVRTVEEAFDINFGLHPVVRSLVGSLGVFVSEKSPIKKTKRKSTSLSLSRRQSATTLPSPSVGQYDYFYSLFDLAVELQTVSVVNGSPLHVSRAVRDALADVVASGALPLLPKFADPAFLYECVSDLLAPACPETFFALEEEEKKWLALSRGEIEADEDETDAPLPRERSPRCSLANLDSKADDEDIFSLGTRERRVTSCSSTTSEREGNPNDISDSLTDVSSALEQLMGRRPVQVEVPDLKEPLEPLPPPRFIFTQFGDYVDISHSAPALSASQEAAIKDAFGDDDEEQVEPRVEATLCDSAPEAGAIDDASSNELSTQQQQQHLSADYAYKDCKTLSSSQTVDTANNSVENSGSFRASCPNLSSVENYRKDDHLSVFTEISAEYDCFSVGVPPAEKSQHFEPHLFSPAPEEDVASNPSDRVDGVSISSGDGAAAPSSTAHVDIMDRLFLSIMIPDTVLCRDPNSGIKYTLYVIHYTAVYPCGPGGALEPRVGTVKRRFREFLTLHERLETSDSFKYSLKGIKGPSKWSGPFPWTNFSKDLIETRRKDLQAYLKSLAALTDISCSQPLREFLAYDADPRIAYVQKAPSYTNMFNLDRFFTKGLKGSLEGVFMPQPSKPSSLTPPETRRAAEGVLVNAQTEADRDDGHEYHPTGSKDVYIKTAAPIMRGKDLSGGSSSTASRCQSPKNMRKSDSSSHLASNLALVANLLGDDEQLLRKGVIDVQFSPARPKDVEGKMSVTPLHVPFGPHFGWGPRGRKEQLRYQNYRSLKPGLSGRYLERQCGYYSVKRLSNGRKDDKKDLDLTDLLFPKNDGEDVENDDAFFDATEDLKGDDPVDYEERPLETTVLDVVLDIAIEAMRSHPSWINYDMLLSKGKLVFGALIDHLIKSKVEDITTRDRWAYYLGLLRMALWPKVEIPPPVRDEKAARKKAFRDLSELLPYPALDLLGKTEVLNAVDAVFDSVSCYNLNLHFIFTAIEIVLQDLFPEVDFVERLAIKLEKTLGL